MNEENIKLERQKLNEQVLERLLSWIMDGTLTMGCRLNAEKIAQQLGVSRMPVREAFTMLEQLGLAEAIPYVGFKLIRLDKRDVHEIYLLRQMLEPEAAAIAARNIDEEGISEMQAIQDDMEKEFARVSPDPRLLHTLNRDFHFTLYQYANFDRLYNMISSLWNNLSFFKFIYSKRYISDSVAASDMISTHKRILELVRARDSEALKQLIKSDLGHHTVDVPAAVSSLMHTDE